MSYTCERCNKIVEDNEKFGSGRFCSRACANTRERSAEVKEKIRNGMLKQTACACQYCGKEFSTLTAKASHERLCYKNPDRLPNPQPEKSHNLVTLYHQKNTEVPHVRLDITYGELDTYRAEHPVCEICGRTAEEVTKWQSKFAAKSLCIDHDHTTNKFRGLLCQYCNRQLGWYETFKSEIEHYLDK